MWRKTTIGNWCKCHYKGVWKPYEGGNNHGVTIWKEGEGIPAKTIEVKENEKQSATTMGRWKEILG